MDQLGDTSFLDTFEGLPVVQTNMVDTMTVIRKREAASYLVESLPAAISFTRLCSVLTMNCTYLTDLNLRIGLGHAFPQATRIQFKHTSDFRYVF